MPLTNLEAAFRRAISMPGENQSRLFLSKGNPALPGPADLLVLLAHQNELSLENPLILTESNKLKVSGRGQILGAENCLIEFAFDASDSEVALRITVDLPDDWTLNHGFPSLPRSYLGAFALKQPQVILATSTDDNALQTEIRCDLPAMGLANVRISVARLSPVYTLHWQAATDWMLDGLPEACLQRPTIRIIQDRRGNASGMCSSTLAVTVTGDYAGTFALPMEVTLPTPGGAIRLAQAADSVTPLPDVRQLAALLGGTALASVIPQRIADLSSGFSLSRAELHYIPRNQRVERLALGITSAHRWNIAERTTEQGTETLLGIHSLSFELEAEQRGQGWSVGGTLGGILQLGEQDIAVRLSKPVASTLWHLVLADSSATNGGTGPIVLPGLDDLLRMAGGNDIAAALPSGFNAAVGRLSLSDLEVVIDPGAGGAAARLPTIDALSFSVNWQHQWDIVPGWFSAQDAYLSWTVTDPLNQRAVRSFECQLDARFSIAGVPLRFVVQLPEKKFRAELYPGQTPLCLHSLATHFLGDANGLADVLPDIRFPRASIAFDLAGQAFSLQAEAYGRFAIIEQWFSIDAVTIDLQLEHLKDAPQRRVRGQLAARFNLLDDITLDVRAALGPAASHAANQTEWAPLTFLGTIPKIRIATLLARLLPASASLPPELEGLGAVEFTDLSLSVTPASGAFRIAGTMQNLQLALPLGAGQLCIKQLVFEFARNTSGQLQCKLSLDGSATLLDIAGLDAFHFALDYNEQQQALVLSGQVDARLMGQPVSLQAGYRQHAGERSLELRADFPQPWTLADIPDVVSLSLGQLALSLATDGQQQTWRVSANACDFQLVDVIRIRNGNLSLFSAAGQTGLSFTATAAEITLDLPATNGAAPGLKLAFQEIRLLRLADSTGNTQAADGLLPGWNFLADVGLSFSAMPGPLDRFLTQQLQARCRVNRDGVKLEASRLTQPVVLRIPVLGEGADALDVGTGILDVENIAITLGKAPALSAELCVGLPSKLNRIFGDRTGSQEAACRVFRTYDPAAADRGLIRARLSIHQDGITLAMLNSPFAGFDVQNGKIRLDLGEFGLVVIDLPTLSLGGKGGFSASGGFAIDRERGLRLPLTPLRALFSVLAQAVRPHDSQTADILSKIGAAIPRGIPIKTFSLFQQNPQTGLKDFSIEMLEQMIAENGGTLDGGRLPDAIRTPLNALGDQLERLPERFKDYLEISIPQAARFSLTLQAAGGVEFAVSTEGDPIRLLLPGFPMLIGVELRKLSFGAVAGGQLLLLAGSLRLDLFDVPTLAATLLLPFEQMQNVLPKAARLRRTAILDDFTMLIIPAGPVPIPVPLFFDKLGLEIVSVEGTEIVSSFSLPRPEFDAQEMLAILSNTLKYFRTPDFYFPLDQLPQHMNIVFTVGPNYLRLPKFLDAYDDAAWPQGAVTGGTVLGTQQALEPVNTLKLIWSLLNTIKRASPHDLIQAIPLKYRVGSKQAALFGFLNTRLDWALTTPEEFVSTAIPTLQLNRDEDVQEILAYLPADSSLGYATLPGWIDPCTDAAAAGQLGIHLRARPRVTAATRGVVALLRGKADLAGVIELDTLVALGAVSGDGMSAGLRFKGRLAGLLDIELAGAAWVAAGQEPRGFRVFGRASASMDPALLGRSEPVLEANWELNRQEIALGGRFNLLPEGCPLQLKGCLSGRLTGVSFELHGDLLFSLGSGFRFAARLALFSGTRQLDGRSENVDEFRLQLAFMAATLALEVIRRDNSLLMRGDFTPISLGGGLVRIEAGARPAGEPAALLQIEQGQLRRFSLHGAIALLGIANSSIDIDYQAEQQTLSFALQHQIDFAGLHHALSLQAHMSSPADIAAHAHFALVLDIGAALAAAVKALTGLPCPVFSLRTGFIIDSSIVLATERAIDPEELQRQEIVRRQQAAATRQQLAEHAQQLASVLEQALLRTAAARLRAEARLNTCHDAVDALRQEIVSTEKQLLGLRQVLEQRAPATAVERAAQVAAYAAAARRLGVEVEAHYALLQNEADALLHDRTLIRMAIETAELDWDRCEAGGDRVQARQLRDTVGKLRREEQLITRAVIQIRDLLTRRPEAELRNAYMQAQQEEQQARADRSATGQPLSASAEQRWAVEAELLRLREATQWQLPLAADDTVHPLPAPPATGKTSFSLKVQASVWLFGIRFQLDLLFEQADLQALAGRDVMASIPQLVQSAILSNAASMIRRGFSSLAAAAGALLRFLMDPAYRRTMLESGRSAAQHFLPAEQAHTLPPATISSPVTAALPTLAASPLAVGTAGELSDDEWASIQQQAHSALDQLSAGLAADSAIDAEHIREMLLTTGWAADDIQQMLDAAASV